MPYSLRQELASIALRDRTGNMLHDRVAQLFLEARDDVYRYLLRLGVYPPEAQEGTQEVFLRLYAALKKGEDIQNPRAWVFRVAHNEGLKIRARQSGAFDPDLTGHLSSAEPGPEQSLLDRERSLRFHQAVERLSEQQRRCLTLRLEGLRYPEIGSVLGISVSAVTEFLRRAIAQLKKGEL